MPLSYTRHPCQGTRMTCINSSELDPAPPTPGTATICPFPGNIDNFA